MRKSLSSGRIFGGLIIGLCLSGFSLGQSISTYESYLAVCTSKTGHRALIALRKFERAGQRYYLLVDPNRLMTIIRPASEFEVAEESWEDIRQKFKMTPYGEAIRDAELNSKVYQNAGITHFFSTRTGIALTVDLCPSQRPLDRILFSELIKEFGQKEKPVPVAVAVTGLWMEKHEPDLRWLLGLEESGAMAITWINHSYNHRTDKNLPLKENFLLERGTNLRFEVLETEKAMIKQGLTPSVFFRFPGLVSDSRLFHLITALGLIPVGSDAWLGKNQWPKVGSIVLVHANGNEPIGIRRFLELIHKERENIINKHWLLFDLRESLMESEKEEY